MISLELREIGARFCLKLCYPRFTVYSIFTSSHRPGAAHLVFVLIRPFDVPFVVFALLRVLVLGGCALLDVLGLDVFDDLGRC